MNKEEKSNEPLITPKAVFGIRIDIPRNIQYISNDKCAYVAGNYIVICTIKEKGQYFIPAVAEFGEITSFSVDELKEYLVVAIGQKSSDSKSNLSIIRYTNRSNSNFAISSFNTDSAKLTKFAGIGLESSDYIVSLSTNVVKGVVIALSGPRTPSKVLIYQHEVRSSNAKLTHSFEMSIYVMFKNVEINPYDPSLFSLYGEGGFAIIQIKDYEKKQISGKLEVDPRTNGFAEFSSFLFSFVGNTWISNTRIAFINLTSDVFIIDFGKKLDNPSKKVIKGSSIFESDSRAKGIFQKNKNLFICKDDGLIIKLEDKQQNDKLISYEKTEYNSKNVRNLPKIEVNTLSIFNHPTSNFAAIMISTHNSQLYIIDISNENALLDGNNYKYFLCQFHGEEITCIDVCKLKQLVVTGSRDRTIKIWNYVNLQNEITSELLEEEPIAVTFHPNGLHIAALFKDKFRLMHLLEKNMIVYKEITTFQPNEIKFSNFGNLFAVCYKNNFQIYNFYSCETVATSKGLSEGYQTHSENITKLTWDRDDSGFATCGADGRAFYWQLNNKESQLIDCYSKENNFNCVEIHNEEDCSKRLLLIDDYQFMEVSQIQKDKEDQQGSNIYKRDLLVPKDVKFSDMIYDQEAKVIILSSSKEHSPAIHVIQNPFDNSGKRYFTYQANSLGIRFIKASYDISNLFTSGKDKCFFVFTIQHVSKTERRDDTLESGNLILVRKNDLDKDAQELRNKLFTIDSEVRREKEKFEEEATKVDKEINYEKGNFTKEIEKYFSSKTNLEEKIKLQIEYFDNELNNMFEEHSVKINDLKSEQEINKTVKEKDKKKEEENKVIEISRNETQRSHYVKNCDDEIQRLKENYVIYISELNVEIKYLEGENNQISIVVEKENADKMDGNDTQISVKRLELENLKRTYEKVKFDHMKLEEKLKNEIKEIKDNIRSADTKKNGDRNELVAFQSENTKLIKQITDMHSDKKEKEDTILEKNNIKRELEKENQELEKFKFVLNYKIKELKHDKDPEERKLQMLEKQAKDMEVEIKKFEFEQAKNIIELSKNHDTMKVKEKQIEETERNIEKIKNYKKLFQESLYFAMKKSKNHKELKKELIGLKRLFLDKEFIQVVEKPYESNYESQRQFLEENITNFGKKINNTQSLFTQDYQKIMRENKKLLIIVNELEKENKEIKITSGDFKMNKTANILRPKNNIKSYLPKFNSSEENSVEQKTIKLKKEFFEIEKGIQFIRETKKKEKIKLDQDQIKMKILK